MFATFRRKTFRYDELPQVVRHKWNDAVMNEGFVPLPKRLLRCLSQVFNGNVAVSELQTILAIADFRRPNQSSGPSLAYLAFISGLPVDAVRNNLQTLKQRGWLRIEGSEDDLKLDLSGILSVIENLTDNETSQ